MLAISCMSNMADAYWPNGLWNIDETFNQTCLTT